MSDDYKIVWTSEEGDTRKKKKLEKIEVDESQVELYLRRLTSGKGRVVIEITNLPPSKNWCKKLAKELKKAMGVGGAYKNDFIELHTEILENVIKFLEKRQLKWKKVGG